jgi:hypothetical protein
MPVIVPDTNVVQVMGGHPEWVDESDDRETDLGFLKLPPWYREELRALSAINLAIPRCYSTAWVPPDEVIAELSRGGSVAQRSLLGWGGEVADWADGWFWAVLSSRDVDRIQREWADAQALDLSFLRDEGDREVAKVAYALRSWHSTVLTLDRKSFWSQRARLARIGIAVSMPTELWAEMAPQL